MEPSRLADVSDSFLRLLEDVLRCGVLLRIVAVWAKSKYIFVLSSTMSLRREARERETETETETHPEKS